MFISKNKIFLAFISLATSAIALFSWQKQLQPRVDQYFEDFTRMNSQIVFAASYYGKDNFLGRPVKAYKTNKCYLTKSAAQALLAVEAEAEKQNLNLKIFDCYRPQQAVADFVTWAKEPDDKALKAKYYPNIEKQDLIPLGYIADQSSHSRGSTVDLTLVDVQTKQELDMGSHFDLFDPLSHTINSQITKKQQANRLLLKSLMEKHRFKNFEKEWWHYTLVNEPYPDKYFDFVVK